LDGKYQTRRTEVDDPKQTGKRHRGQGAKSRCADDEFPSWNPIRVETVIAHAASCNLRTTETSVTVVVTDGMRRPVSGRDAIRSQVIGVLEAQEIKETGNEKG
jgi:hypothetical protein